MDATPVGMVRPSLYLPDGYVLANGATVKRADYPRLVALADAQSLWTDDTAANLGLYGKGDGTTTMVLPNWVGRMAQYASAAGVSVAAGLPNITGTIVSPGDNLGTMAYKNKKWADSKDTGAFYVDGGLTTSAVNLHDMTWYHLTASEEYTCYFDDYFSASRSNAIYGNSTTVQPAAINVLPILRY